MLPSWLKQAIVLMIFVMTASSYRNNYLQSQRLKLEERLPTSITPNSYNLKLFPHITEGYYNGSVLINITCREPTHAIVMHANENLIINHEQLIVRNEWGSVNLSISNTSRNGSSEMMTITLDEEMQNGDTYQIYIEFSGKLKGSDVDYRYSQNPEQYGGFFMGSYENADRKERSWFVATCTFPTFARRVFPCFDEPSFKARFQISVARLSNMSTLSVVPLESTEIAEEEDYVWDHFHPTPPISTFSVNVLVSDFKSQNLMNATNSQVLLHHHQSLGMDTFEENAKLIPLLLEYLEDYLGAVYPLPKLDIVALPWYNYNAEGNSFGLIMLQEYMLQYRQPGFVNTLVEQWVYHMITPQRWSDFGVADVLSSYLGRNAEKKLTNKSQSSELQPYYLYDLFGTHFNYSNYGQDDQFTLKKGELFLQMLNFTLTENTLKTALRNFILNNLYSTFTEDMLWAALTHQAHTDRTLPESLTVESIAQSWIHNDLFHYPVVTVTRNYDDNSASLEQHVFMTELPRNMTEEEEGLLWPIPIMYISPENMDPGSVHPTVWMEGRHLDIKKLPDSQSFIIVNPTDDGMYLVNYDKHNWKLLTQHLIESDSHLRAETRAKLLHNALILAAGGELDYILALNVTLFLFKETDYSVWTPMLNQIQNMEKFYQYTSLEDKMNAYFERLLAPIFHSSDYPDYATDPDYATFYYSARPIFQKVGHQSSIDEARKQLEAIMPTFSINDSDTQLVLFCPEFMRNSSENWPTRTEELQTFMDTIYDIRHFIEKSLAKCPGYTDYIQRTLNGFLDEDMVFSSNEWYQITNMITSSEIAHSMTFSYFLKHYQELKQKFYFMKDMWTPLVSTVMNRVNTQDGLNKLMEFYNQYKNKLGYSQSTVEDSIKQVTMTVEWLKKNAADIEYWLDHVLPNFSYPNK